MACLLLIITIRFTCSEGKICYIIIKTVAFLLTFFFKLCLTVPSCLCIVRAVSGRLVEYSVSCILMFCFLYTTMTIYDNNKIVLDKKLL